LLRAELQRNIGEFDKRKMLLEKIKNKKEHKNFISAIKSAAEAKNTLTVEIFEREENEQ